MSSTSSIRKPGTPGTFDSEERETLVFVNKILREVRQDLEQPEYSKEVDARNDMRLRLAQYLLPEGQRASRNLILASAERKAGLDAATLERDFNQWVRRGISGVDRETRGRLDSQFIKDATQVRALSTMTTAGFLVPESFAGAVDLARKRTGSVRFVARIVQTDTGRDLPAPTVDDTSNLGELLVENAPATEQDVVVGQVTMKSSKYSSKVVAISMELLQDQAVDITTSTLPELLGTRIARIENQHFTTGTGTGQPQGIVTGCALGKTAASATAVTVDELWDLILSVDPEYRANGTFMARDETVLSIVKLKDTANQRLVNFDEKRLLGYPFVSNPNMALMGSNARSILFGDFQSAYVVRDITSMALIRLQEAYAAKAQIGFLLFTRSDGRVLNPSAVKALQQAA